MTDSPEDRPPVNDQKPGSDETSVRRPATIRDVARLAGVATGTVSRVINGEQNVHAAIRKAILAAVDELNYRPSPVARNLRRGRTHTIGFVISDLATPSFLAAIPTAQEYAREQGYSLLVADSQLNREIEAKNIRSMSDSRVDGLLWTAVSPMQEALVEVFRTPIVTFTDSTGRYPSVGPDLRAPIVEAFEELIATGHRKIGLVSLRGLWSNMAHLAPLSAMFPETGARLVSDSSWTFPTRTDCLRSLPAKLRAQQPTALVVPSSILGTALICLRQLGLAVPADVSIVCIGDCELAQAYNPPITSISYDYQLQARTGMETLFALIAGKEPGPRLVIIESQLIRRASTAPPQSA